MKKSTLYRREFKYFINYNIFYTVKCWYVTFNDNDNYFSLRNEYENFMKTQRK